MINPRLEISRGDQFLKNPTRVHSSDLTILISPPVCCFRWYYHSIRSFNLPAHRVGSHALFQILLLCIDNTDSNQNTHHGQYYLDRGLHCRAIISFAWAVVNDLRAPRTVINIAAMALFEKGVHSANHQPIACPIWL